LRASLVVQNGEVWSAGRNHAGCACVAQTCRAWVGEADTSRDLGGCGVTWVCATGRNYEPWRVGEYGYLDWKVLARDVLVCMYEGFGELC
jgi:hypothetical protein